MELQQICVTIQVICVSLTIRLSSTHSPQYMFESWLQYCKSYNHICIDGTAQFERNWQQKEMYPECCRTLQLRVKVKGEGPVTELTGPMLGSSSFAYEHAHTPWNQASTCTTIVLMLQYTTL